MPYGPRVHPARPAPVRLACPACGEPVDRLRSGAALAWDDGQAARVLTLCTEQCRDAFAKRGPRSTTSSAAQFPAPLSVPQRVRDATRPSIELPTAEARRSEQSDQGVPIPWPELVAAAGGMAVALVARTPFVGTLSALLTLFAAAASLVRQRHTRQDIGLLTWLVGPAGVCLAAVGGALSLLGEPQRWSLLAGAALAAVAVVARAYLDERGRAPVRDHVARNLATLPIRARIPARAADGSSARYDEVAATDVRAGEVVLVVEGEALAVDGVVEAGEARVLLHPGARAPQQRKPGDSLVAGARLTDGALRIRATRVGEERALPRIRHFGLLSGRRAARTSRLADRIRSVGGVAAVFAACAAVLLTNTPGVAGALSAAGAVLIATPLLAARRSAQSPFVAAAASATQRGIIFADARTMDAAGRVGTAALCTTGTVTEAEPEIVEVTPVGDASIHAVIGWVAGACQEADVPLARGAQRYARAHHVQTLPVRRVIAQAGRGMTAFADSRELVVGSRQLLLEHGISIAVADAAAARAEERAETAVFVGVGGRVQGVIALRDTVRPGARAAVQRMFDQNIEVIFLSGDHRATVEALARSLDVQNVKAELTPSEQGDAVEGLKGSGGLVAVVGHAALDGTALGAADVPIVLDAAGGPHGERGVALATTDIRDAAAALWIARAARTEAWRGVLLASAAGAVAMTGAAFGWVAPAAAAIVALCVDVYTLSAGARLLHRIALRVPMR